MKKRTDCDFATMARSIGGLADGLMKPPDGLLRYEGNLDSETRQLC
jgi:hypothetical protein